MTESSEEESEVYGRNNFQSRAHKLAALFLMTAGSANATQFPLMFIVYGGTPFLLAYLVFLGTVALPMMRLESNLAQFSGDGNRGIFSAVPLFIGLGYTMSLYAIVHIVGDSVPVSDQLLFLFGSLRNFTTWSDCPHFMTPNRTCYPLHRHGFALCKTARARLADAFRKQALSHGVPAVGTGEHMQVVLVPPKVYQHDVAGCLPAVPNYLQQYLVRRQQADWSASSLTYIRAPPLLSLAAVWMLVFAIAHQGFTTVKRFVYAMLGIHLATSCLLLIRGISLPGAMRGLSMLLYADWSHAINQEMWSNALYVSLESVGVTGTIYLGIVRFNNFKNKYQQDVNFVLVADTASKGLRTFITFMFLGHLASTIGVDVRMLVHMESNFVVEIMPQAMSVVPYHQLWSHVHSLWLLSTMIPKFLIVPDIVIEVLSPVNPFFFLNRTVVHFFVCMSLLLASIIVCTPGGANFAAMIVHNHDQNLRFAVLFLESVVFLQYCGIRRLDIICRMMTGRDYTIFVKICLASVVPVIVVCLFCAELLYAQAKESHHPLWIYGLITWFDLVQLSCVAVFAVVFMGESGMTFENCLLPLPTWLPASWDRGMHYRHMMAGEGIDPAPTPPTPTSTVARPEKVTSRPSTDTSSSSSSTSSSSTEFMGTHLVVASDHRFAIPGNGREPGGRDVSAAAATSVHTQQQRMADPTAVGATKSMAPSISEGRMSATVEPESGTLHVSRNLSSVRRSMMRHLQRALRRDSQAQVRAPGPKIPGRQPVDDKLSVQKCAPTSKPVREKSEERPKEHSSLVFRAPATKTFDQRVPDAPVDQKSAPTFKPTRQKSCDSVGATIPKMVEKSASSAKLPEPKPLSTGSSRKRGEKALSKRQAAPANEQVPPVPPAQDHPGEAKPVKSKRKKEQEGHKREQAGHKGKEPRTGRQEGGNPAEPAGVATPPSAPGRQASMEKRHRPKPGGPSPRSQHAKHRKANLPTDKEAPEQQKANVYDLVGMALTTLRDSTAGANVQGLPEVGSKPTGVGLKADKSEDVAGRPSSAVKRHARPANVQAVADNPVAGAAEERVQHKHEVKGCPPPPSPDSPRRLSAGVLPQPKKGSEASLRSLGASFARAATVAPPEDQRQEKRAGADPSLEPRKPASAIKKKASVASIQSAKSLAAEIVPNLEPEPNAAVRRADQGAARGQPEVVHAAKHGKEALRKQQKQDEPKASSPRKQQKQDEPKVSSPAKPKKPKFSPQSKIRKQRKEAGNRDGASPSAHNAPRSGVPTAGLGDPTQKKPPGK